MNKWENVDIDFLGEEEVIPDTSVGTIKVLVVDDDDEIHRVTNMVLKGFTFEKKTVELLHAYTGQEALEMLEKHQNIQVVFLDVVMETNTSGLDIIKKIRKELDLKLLRIVLRTGQPGEAPEESVIHDYDINDYHLKTELTARRLKTTLIAALRNYRDLMIIEGHRKGLEKIIEASGRLFQHNQLGSFLESILEEMSNFQVDNPDIMYIRQKTGDGFLTINNENKNQIVAATGKFSRFIGHDIEDVEELRDINFSIETRLPNEEHIKSLDKGILVQSIGKSKMANYIYIEGNEEGYDYNLIRLFMNNFSIALDNFILNNLLNTTQKEILIALAETVESHFQETGSHIRRIANMMYKFSYHMNFSYSECEMLKLASTMHDLGKIAIPDAILKKPGRLTKEEFEIMKTHPNYGYKILNKSGLEILKTAANIALYHHEKFDGSGYPTGLQGKDIPVAARMMAICDVFDAMTHKRVYKDAMSNEEAVSYLNANKGSHFDGNLVDIFLNHLTDITDDLEAI